MLQAKRIIAYARLQHHPRTAGLEGLFLPLFLFANKMDLHIGKMRRGTDSMNDQNQVRIVAFFFRPSNLAVLPHSSLVVLQASAVLSAIFCRIITDVTLHSV